MNSHPSLIAFIVLLLTIFPVLYMETKSKSDSQCCFTSRFYSLLKRLGWGLFFNGIVTGVMMAFLKNHTRMNQVTQGTLALVQLTVVPILLAIWAYRRPRVYQKKPSLFFPLLLGFLLFIDYWMTMTMLVFAVGTARPILVAI